MRKPTSEYLRWQVTPLLSAQWALGNDLGVWHGANGRRDVLTASFATDGIPNTGSE
jgi:hypothetical protein